MMCVWHLPLWQGIFLVSLVAFGVNIPLGYLRAGVRKFSPAWFLYVHLSIPLIILLRLSLGLGYAFIPIFIAMAVGGQLAGGRMRNSCPGVKNDG